MKRTKDPATAHAGDALTPTMKYLLVFGIVSSVLYVCSDWLASAILPGYVFADQAVSELMAIGAATRPLMLGLMAAYNVLVIAFAAGVWKASERVSLRITAVMLVIYAVVGEVTQVFSPMHQRGSIATGTDVGHMILTAVEVLSLVAFMAFASGAGGRGFRAYSIATIVIVMAAGITTGAVATHMTALASSTPWSGLMERVNIYCTMLWIGTFALTMLRARLPHSAARAGARPSVAHVVTTAATMGRLR